MKISAGELAEALREIGACPEARDILLAALLRIEPLLEQTDFDVREQVTGPVCDALHVPAQPITRTLADGTVMSARYASKIARDFVMAAEAQPDHVWEPQTTRALLALGARARHVVVGGAYIGDHAVLLARQIAGRGIVHCFEPGVENLALLRLNLASNGITNVAVNGQGLWSSSTTLSLTGNDCLASPAEDAGGRIDATSIDLYADQCGIEAIDLIMLDIEGGELEALRGASAFLSRPPPEAPVVVFEVHSLYVDWSQGLRAAGPVALLIAHGYSVFALRDYHSNVAMAGAPIELIPADDVWLEGPPHGFNMLAVKDVNLLDPALFHFVSGVSPKLLRHRSPGYHAPLYPERTSAGG